MSRVNALAKTEATQYHVQLGLTYKDRAIKGLVVNNDWDLKPLNLALLVINRPLRYTSFDMTITTYHYTFCDKIWCFPLL